MNSRRCISAEETAAFCSQVVLFLQAGLSIEEGITALCEGMKNESKYFRKIENSVRESGLLYEGIKDIGIFPEYMIKMIKIGEETDNIEKTMGALCKFYERESKLYKIMHNAILYPISLLIVMLCVIAILIKVIMPIFRHVFVNLQEQITVTNKAVMNLGFAAGGTTIFVGIILLAIIFLIYICAQTNRGRTTIKKILSKFPIIKNININIETARFSYAVAMLINNGEDVQEAIERGTEVINESTMKVKFLKAAELVKGEKSYDDSLSEMNLYNDLHRRMIRMGIITGKLDVVMEKMATIYEKMAEENIERCLAAIEPIMIAILSVITGGILISVMLPLISIMANI